MLLSTIHWNLTPKSEEFSEVKQNIEKYSKVLHPRIHFTSKGIDLFFDIQVT